MMRAAATLVATDFPAFAASDFLKQFGPGDLHDEVAAAMERDGCTKNEGDIFDVILDKAGGISDASVVVRDLTNTGDLVRDGKDSYSLRGWGKCK